MRVSLKWLRDYVDVSLPAEELARRLTMAGIEVEAIHRGEWEHVWVARIQKIAPHPNADRLRLVQAEYGQGREQQVVTGASNISEGDIVPLGLVGTRYLDGHSTPPVHRVLQPTNMRGVPSEGMVMSGFELGISDDHSGIMILPPETRVGVPLSEVLGDTVIELDLKGRADCLAMLGVAREVAALTEGQARIPMVDPGPARERRPDEPLTIEIEDAALCRRYTGVLLENVTIGPSPAWLQERLQAAGQHPINNVVDVTNFVMLEWGQPLHAFDYRTLRGGRIVVRRAKEGETLLTLAAERPELRLTSEHLVIADAERPIALAGVIGGKDTEIPPSGTVSVLLESANFDPISIRRTARTFLSRPTEASRRFERGIPPDHTMPAAMRAAQLLVELAGAEIVGEPVDTYPAPLQRLPIRLPRGELKRQLGIEYEAETVGRVFDRLGFVYEKPSAQNGESFVVNPPVWRLDIERPADLVEEVARIDGYDKVPTTLMRGDPPVPAPNVLMDWEDKVRSVLAAAGFDEIMSYPLTSLSRLARFPHTDGQHAEAKLAALIDDRIAPPVEPVQLANPSSQDQDVLRTSLMPGLLDSLRDNLRHADRDAHLFEIGRIYIRREGDLPEERRSLGLVTGAFRTGSSWSVRLENDFFYVKAVLEALLERLGISGHGYLPVQHPAFHPYRTAAVVLNHRPESAGKKPVLPEEVLGIVGEVDEETRRAFDLGQRSYAVAVDLDRLLQHAKSERKNKALPEHPAVMEDLAFVVRKDVPAERIEASIRRAGAPLVEHVNFFDLYEGDAIQEGMKSVAYEVVYRAPDHTLTNDEVAAVRQKVVQLVERQTGAKLRS